MNPLHRTKPKEKNLTFLDLISISLENFMNDGIGDSASHYWSHYGNNFHLIPRTLPTAASFDNGYCFIARFLPIFSLTTPLILSHECQNAILSHPINLQSWAKR